MVKGKSGAKLYEVNAFVISNLGKSYMVLTG
jgi:hypothetical protein